MQNLKMGFDDNLGLPIDFAQTIGCEVIAYHDLTTMLQAFIQKKLSAIFIPAGTLPYIKNYNLISQSCFGPSKQLNLESDFVTTKQMSISDIKNCTLGRVNQYCTTSFWAPLIYLLNYLPRHSSLKFQDTDSFQDMLIKAAEERIDCAMVWNIILQQNPQPASKVHTLFSKKDLPTPVIIADDDFPSLTIEKINRFQSKDLKSFFPSFQKPDLNAINQFKSDMEKAAKFYDLGVEAIA